MLTFGKFVITKVQYPTCNVRQLYSCVDIMDVWMLKKSLGHPF
jgi:hypothetical protein